MYIPNENQVALLCEDITEDINKQKRIEYLNFHDELTGLYNRRYLDKALELMNKNENLPLTIMVFDVNNLKLANDVFGHFVGDKILKESANLLKEVFTNSKYIARIGGDEYSVLLPNTTQEQAKSFRKKLRDLEAKYKVEPLQVSMAKGYATKTMPSQNIQDIFSDADTAMYQDKLENKQKVLKNTLKLILDYNYKNFPTEKLHNERVGELSLALYKVLGKNNSDIDSFEEIVLYHDIGKVAIPKEIINKNTKLTENEYEKIKSHSKISYQILRILDENNPFINSILYHHERIDGKGYPEGLRGEEILLEAKVISIADAYESMTSYRPYREALTKQEAIDELIRNKGTQFDSNLVDVFVDLLDIYPDCTYL